MKRTKFNQKIVTILLGVLLSVFLSLDCMVKADEKGLQEIKGEHFIVYFAKDEEFARGILDKAEFFYREIANELGYGRHSKFWTWEKRVKILVFPNKQDFLNDTGMNDWSEGVADYTEMKIISHMRNEDFLSTLLPHEIAHLIFRDYVGFKSEVPLWLDEGVAQWMEPQKKTEVMWVMAQLLEEEKAIPLEELMKLDIREEKYEGELVYIFYVEAASLVGFMIKEHGSKKFAEFCRQLRDGKSLEVALTFAYPTDIRNIKDLEEQWKKYIKKGGS
ncbi:peptidase MA family metallohydrolase [Candidatus Omnitrophota bacterium]